MPTDSVRYNVSDYRYKIKCSHNVHFSQDNTGFHPQIGSHSIHGFHVQSDWHLRFGFHLKHGS